jgi:hypothetical protein
MSTQPPAAAPEAERCKELWFEDGTVILRSHPVVFRVYQGLLSLQSQVFRDMFSMPQPIGTEKMDGVPVVDLLDNPEDLKNFLRALNDTW